MLNSQFTAILPSFLTPCHTCMLYFRGQRNLHEYYYLIQMGAVAFIEGMEAKSLSISEEEFEE
ncbi:hypothetical protein BC937DRAFT_89911 [Endogone sp. FLAS-F59071]|nr:hypothetical protein BC937DRAFT_89911 [Endogone sp. FLAS-F59071]|eukprot:RUS17494.1 hypothetical protein BC937DRAFT_89911 [Endogone sp. FLAS-F59071]